MLSWAHSLVWGPDGFTENTHIWLLEVWDSLGRLCSCLWLSDSTAIWVLIHIHSWGFPIDRVFWCLSRFNYNLLALNTSKKDRAGRVLPLFRKDKVGMQRSVFIFEILVDLCLSHRFLHRPPFHGSPILGHCHSLLDHLHRVRLCFH